MKFTLHVFEVCGISLMYEGESKFFISQVKERIVCVICDDFMIIDLWNFFKNYISAKCQEANFDKIQRNEVKKIL
jgi:hypothetical protein